MSANFGKGMDVIIITQKVHSQIVSVQERLKCLQTVEFQNINSELWVILGLSGAGR